MKDPVDLAVTLESAADKLPDLVFDKAGKLVSGTPSKPMSSGKTKPKTKRTR
jgi:hypothetical protein